MAGVYFDPSVGGNGSTVTDDDNAATGLMNGGSIIRIVPMFQQVVNVALWVKNTATSIVSNTTLTQNWATLTTGLVSAIDYSAKAYAIGGTGVTGAIGSAKEWATSLGLVDGTYYGARKYAQDALASANAAAQQANTLTATSITSTLIGTGSKTFTTQSGEQFIAGQFVTIASQANPANYLYGQVTSYSTTSLVVNVTAVGGTGTFADWLISLSGLQGVQGNTGATASVTNGNPTNINGLVKGNGSALSPVVSGTDIKTVGGLSILGSGDVSIAGDATETSTNTHVSLISTSTKVQSVAITAADKNVYLPNATTCQKGELFTIKNTGANQFCIRDGSSKFLCALNPNQVVTISLSNNSTSSGTWVIANNSTNTDLIAFYQNTITTVNSASILGCNLVNLTPTTYLAVYAVSSNTYAVVLTVNSDNTVSQGSIVSIAALSVGNCISCAKISATQVVVFYGAGASIYAVVLSISGTTVTVNSPVTVTTGGTNYALDVCVLTPSLILVAYNINGTQSYAQTLSLSGTTLTVNSNQTAISSYGNSNVSRNGLIPLSATSATLQGSGTAFILSGISTTAITVTTADFGVNYNTSDLGSILISPNTILGAVGDASIMHLDYSSIATISGTTVTSKKTVSDSPQHSLNFSQYALTLLNSSKAVLVKWGNSAINLFSYTISDKEFKRTERPYCLYSGYGANALAIDNDGAGKVMMLATNNSINNYLTASVIEVAP